MPLKSHPVHLHTSRLHLRPMTDADWDTLLRWNQDPEVLYYADYNPRSRTAFAKVGFRVVAHIALPPGGKARSTCDMRIARTEWAAGANPLA